MAGQRAGLKDSIEALMMAAQEQPLSTRSIEPGVYHTTEHPRCSLCKNAPTRGQNGRHPPRVVENDQTKVLWDVQIQTDKQVMANQPDTVVVVKQRKTAVEIEVAI